MQCYSELKDISDTAAAPITHKTDMPHELVVSQTPLLFKTRTHALMLGGRNSYGGSTPLDEPFKRKTSATKSNTCKSDTCQFARNGAKINGSTVRDRTSTATRYCTKLLGIV